MKKINSLELLNPGDFVKIQNQKEKIYGTVTKVNFEKNLFEGYVIIPIPKEPQDVERMILYYTSEINETFSFCGNASDGEDFEVFKSSRSEIRRELDALKNIELEKILERHQSDMNDAEWYYNQRIDDVLKFSTSKANESEK